MTKKTLNRAPPYVYHPENGLSKEILRVTVPSPIPSDLYDEPRITQRSWKSINSQYCVVCKEGGNILCCDNCPASFHLMCHQPIIFPDEIPEGKWLCNRCKTTPLEKRTPRQAIENNVNVDTYEYKKNLEAAQDALKADDPPENPLLLLANAAAAQNAFLYELPIEYDTDYMLMPGEHRAPRPELKEVQCDSCKQTDSRNLVQCDFCSNKYHLDCLNPPLVGTPKDKWMCPNHVESVVDQKLLKSLSIVRRRELWRKYARQEIDEIAIYKAFFNKIEKNRTTKKRKPESKPLKVSGAIKDLYAKRWTPGDDRSVFTDEKKRNEFIEKVVDVQSKTLEISLSKCKKSVSKKKLIPKNSLSSNKLSANRLSTEPFSTKDSSSAAPIDVNLYQNEDEKRLCSDHASSTDVIQNLLESLLEALPDSLGCKETNLQESSYASKSKIRDTKEPVSFQEKAYQFIFDLNAESMRVDDCTKSVLSNDKASDSHRSNVLEKVIKEEVKEGNEEVEKKETSEILANCISRFKAATDPNEKKIMALAIERLQQLIRRTTVQTTQPAIKGFHSHCFMKEWPILAVLKAEGSEYPYAVQRAVTNIGLSKDCHVCLLDISKTCCTALLPHHATIVFDKVLRRFELQPNLGDRVYVDGIPYGKEQLSSNIHCLCTGNDQRAVNQTAPLRNGSYIVIGCLKFVFASFY